MVLGTDDGATTVPSMTTAAVPSTLAATTTAAPTTAAIVYTTAARGLFCGYHKYFFTLLMYKIHLCGWHFNQT